MFVEVAFSEAFNLMAVVNAAVFAPVTLVTAASGMPVVKLSVNVACTATPAFSVIPVVKLVALAACACISLLNSTAVLNWLDAVVWEDRLIASLMPVDSAAPLLCCAAKAACKEIAPLPAFVLSADNGNDESGAKPSIYYNLVIYLKCPCPNSKAWRGIPVVYGFAGSQCTIRKHIPSG